jgi:hypothetical protein
MTRKYNNTVRVLEEELLDRYGRPISSAPTATPGTTTAAPGTPAATPGTTTAATPGTTPAAAISSGWVKSLLSDLSTYYGDYASSAALVERLYSYTNVGFLAQKNIDLDYYAVQDLLRQLYSLKSVNPEGVARRTVLQWKDFVAAVQKNISTPEVSAVFKDWEDQSKKDPSEYVIRDSAIYKYYYAKLKEKDIAAIAAYETYKTYTIYEALRKILERRLNAGSQFQAKVINPLVNRVVPMVGKPQYEQVLLSVLLHPEKYANAENSFPESFTKDCDIRPEILKNIGLLCEQFYLSQLPRLFELTAKKEAEKASAAQPEFNFEDVQVRRGDITKYISFAERYNELTKINELVKLSDIWNSFKQNVTRGPAAAQAAHNNFTQYFKKLTFKPTEKPEYQMFIKQGIIKTNTSSFDTSITPSKVIDSTAIQLNNKPLIYTLEVIDKLNTPESKRLVDSIKSVAENTTTDQSGSNFRDAMKTLASKL